jgi:hypothetical protein
MALGAIDPTTTRVEWPTTAQATGVAIHVRITGHLLVGTPGSPD